MFDPTKFEKQIQSILALLDFFNKSGMPEFKWNLGGRYDLTIYKVDGIIRIDLKPISKDVSESENGSDDKTE